MNKDYEHHFSRSLLSLYFLQGGHKLDQALPSFKSGPVGQSSIILYSFQIFRYEHDIFLLPSLLKPVLSLSSSIHSTLFCFGVFFGFWGFFLFFWVLGFFVFLFFVFFVFVFCFGVGFPSLQSGKRTRRPFVIIIIFFERN